MIDLNKARADLGDRAKDLTDEQLAKRLYKGFGLSAPFEQVAKPLFGFDPENNAKRRFGQAVDEFQGSLYGVAGLAGDALGIDSVKDWGLKNAQRNFTDSAQQARFTDDITNLGKDGFDLGAYASGGLGYLGANVLPSIASGGVGALVGKKLAQEGAERLVKETVESATKKGLSKELLDESKKEIGDKVRSQALAQGAKKYATLGTAGTSYVQSAGGLYADLGGEDPNAVAKSLGYAVPIAALDTVAEISAVKGLLGGSKPSKLIAKEGGSLLGNTARVTGRVAGGAARQGAIEGSTEVLQGGIERFAKNEDVLDKNAMINEFALGALGGGSVGSVSSAINRGESAELTMKAKEYAVKTRDDVLNTTFQNQTNALNKQFERDAGSAAELSGFQPSGKTVAENATNVTPDAQDDTEDLITTFGATPFRNTAGALSRVDIGGRSYLGKEANSTLDTLRKVRTQFGDYGTKYVTSFIEPNVKAPTVSQMFSDLKNLGVTPDAPVEDVVPLVDGLINQAADIRNIDKRNQRIDSLTRFKSAITGQAPVAATPPVATPAQPASPVRTADDEAFNSFVDDLNAQEERRNAQNGTPANEGGSPAPAVEPTTPVEQDRELNLEDENDILIALLQKRTAKSTRQEAENAVNLLFENPEAQKESAAAEGLTLDQYKQRLKRFKQFLGIGGNEADRAVKLKKLQELATELGVPFEAVERSIARLREAGTQGTNNFGTDSTIDGTIEDASQGLSLSDIKARLDTALAALPEEERSKVESDPTVYSEFVQKQLTKDELAIVNRAQIQKETTQTAGDMESINGSTENAEGDSKAIVNIRSSANQTAYASDLEKRLAEGKDDASKKMTKAVAEVERSKKELIAAIAADNDQDAIDAAQKRFDDALDNLTGSSEDYVNSAKPNAKDLADINKGFESFVDKVKGEVEGAYSGISTTEAPTAKSVAAPETTVVERELTKIVGRQQAYKIGDKTITLRLADAGITYGKLSAYPDIIEKVRVSVEKGTLVNDLPAIAEAFASKVKRSVVKDGQPDESSLLLAAMMDAKYRVAKPAAERKVKALRKRLVETYQRMGLETAFLDAVDSIEVGNLMAYNAEGVYFSGDTSIMLDALFVERASEAEILGVMHHEVGHAFDFMFDDAQFSSDPLFNMRKTNDGALTGQIVEEIKNGSLWSQDFEELMQYPMQTFNKHNLGYDEIRAEVFAQLWRGMFDTKMADAFDASTMPKIMAFLEGAVNELKNYGESAGDGELRTQPGSSGVQSQTTGGSGQSSQRAGSGNQPYASRSGTSGNKASGSGNVPRVKSAVDRLPQGMRPMASAIAQTVGYYADRAVNMVFNTRDLISRAEKLMPTAKEIARLFDAKQSMVNSLEKKYRELYAQYAVLDEPIKAKLDNVIFEATRLQDNDYQLGNKYSALPKEAQAIVDAVFEMGKNELVTKRDSIISQIDALIAKTEDDRTKRSLETSKTDLTEQYKKLLKGPYAPLSRFGNFVVVAKSAAYIEAERNEDASKLKRLRSSGKDYYVSYFDSMYEANRQRQELQKEGFVDVPEPFRKDDLRAEMFAGPVVLDTINKLKAEVPVADGDNKREIAAAKRLNNLLDQLYLSTLAEDSIRGYRLNRDGVAGNANMMQAFFARGQVESRFMASLVHNPQLNDVFRKLKAEADKGDKGTKQERREYYLELLARHSEESGAPAGITSALMKLNSIMYLSLSPGYYLTNLTQVPMMTVPFLAGKYGYAKAWRETFRAYVEVAGMLRNAKFNEQPSIDKLPSDIREFAKMMLDEGWMENSAINDLGNIEFETKGAATKALKKADLFLRELQLKSETINRVTSAFAAYRLAGGGEKGIEMAREAINRTQGDYSDFNAPRFMRSNIGKIATQFRKYQIMQLGTLATLFSDWKNGATPEESRVAGRQLAFMLGHAAVMGGMKGLPIVGLVAAAVMAMTDDEDDAEEEIIRLFGEDMGVLITRGMPAFLGTDTSGKLGFGNTFSLFPYTDYDLSKKSGWEKLAFALTGPSGSTLANIGEGASTIADGEFYRGALMAAPSGFANLIKSIEYQGEGVVNRRGEVQIAGEDLTAWDSVAKAFGYPSTKVALSQYYTRRANDLKQTYQEQENTLRRQYVDAFKDKDTDTMTELRDQWREIQLEKREKGIKVNPLSNLIKSPSNERERANVKSDGVRVPEGFEGYVQGIRG